MRDRRFGAPTRPKASALAGTLLLGTVAAPTASAQFWPFQMHPPYPKPQWEPWNGPGLPYYPTLQAKMEAEQRQRELAAQLAQQKLEEAARQQQAAERTEALYAKAKARGFVRTSFKELAIDGKSMAMQNTAIVLAGWYVKRGNIEYLFPDQTSALMDNESRLGVPIITDNASKAFRGFLYDEASKHPPGVDLPVKVMITGYVSILTKTSVFLSSSEVVGIEVVGDPRFDEGPLAAAPPTSTVPAPALADGMADRQKWESWFGTTVGDFRDGASYWAGQRSLKNPGSCELLLTSPAIAGCQAAKDMLTPMDVRRKADINYKTGWNSL
jgi:hypothetical protein